MKSLMDKFAIIKLKEEGKSNRAVAKLLNIDRKTVSRYWKEYLVTSKEIKTLKDDMKIKELQEGLVNKPRYNSSSRKRHKYTEKIEIRLKEILEEEDKKEKLIGNKKQNLTKKQIHKKLLSEGYDISLTTINKEINILRNKKKECFIRQEYGFGERLEYDFGEVKLFIDKELKVFHMAVISSPAGKFRWAYLYDNQKKAVFMDSHVKFFKMIGGVYKEVVYDNMRNVVSKFIGPNEKTLNEDLLKLSLYYGFSINVTNSYSGNEKGYVESSVKIIRKEIFAPQYEFRDLDEARKYLDEKLIEINKNSLINEEKKYLLEDKIPLELGEVSYHTPNKYSFICVDNNFYSLPEYLVSKEVLVKKYYDKIIIYKNNEVVCDHKRLEGKNNYSVNIFHYLDTLKRKPGAIKNSKALKSIPQLKAIFDFKFKDNPKEFIKKLKDNEDLSLDEILKIFKEDIFENDRKVDEKSKEEELELKTMGLLVSYNNLVAGGFQDAY